MPCSVATSTCTSVPTLSPTRHVWQLPSPVYFSVGTGGAPVRGGDFEEAVPEWSAARVQGIGMLRVVPESKHIIRFLYLQVDEATGGTTIADSFELEARATLAQRAELEGAALTDDRKEPDVDIKDIETEEELGAQETELKLKELEQQLQEKQQELLEREEQLQKLEEEQREAQLAKLAKTPEEAAARLQGDWATPLPGNIFRGMN